jgi:hypothetical protein
MPGDAQSIQLKHSAPQQKFYSISSSARTSVAVGTVRQGDQYTS